MSSPLNLCDFYKTDHRRQYPKDTTLVYSNLTPRSSRIDGVDEVVFFGLQYFIKEYLLKQWSEGFFSRTKYRVMEDYKRRMDTSLGKDAFPLDHISALHDYGHLPLNIRAIPEGSLVPIKVPCTTMWNSHPDFFWITNYLETILSTSLWGPMTSATTARRYRKVLDSWCEKTGGDKAFVDWQAHDFSMRGMFGLEAARMSGAGHLLSFTGTDSVPSIDFHEEYYGADCNAELIGGSVPATEHSVMCMGTETGEIETFRHLINEVYPKGVVSIVSDTWDLWQVITEYLPILKDEIMSRDGKVVIRPDSGDPVIILCGRQSYEMDVDEIGEVRCDALIDKGYDSVLINSGYYDLKTKEFLCSWDETLPEHKGVVECLWDIFGGTVNEKGFKQLDPHIGAIYGDSITVERADEICRRLAVKGFASTNVVFGVGSYTYQYVTRDTFGMAMKATYGEVRGRGRMIFKDPKTDSGTKKSAKGLLAVNKGPDGRYFLKDQVSWEESLADDMIQVMTDGKHVAEHTLHEIRQRLLLQ